MKGIWVPSDPAARLPDDLVAFLQEKGFVSSTLIESALDDSSRDAAYDLLAALEAPLIKSRLWSKALVDWLASGGGSRGKAAENAWSDCSLRCESRGRCFSSLFGKVHSHSGHQRSVG